LGSSLSCAKRWSLSLLESTHSHEALEELLHVLVEERVIREPLLEAHEEGRSWSSEWIDN
jgi:hypothetical protein